MYCANILFTRESLRQRVFDAPFLIFTMGKRASISQSTSVELFPMPAHRCLVLHILLLIFVLGLIRIPDWRISSLPSSLLIFILFIYAISIVCIRSTDRVLWFRFFVAPFTSWSSLRSLWFRSIGERLIWEWLSLVNELLLWWTRDLWLWVLSGVLHNIGLVKFSE